MKIRYHHLMCIPRFEGKGYSEDFVKNLANIKPLFEKGEYTLTDKNDDVCACCPSLVNGKCTSEEKVARYDLAVKEALEKGVTPLPCNICTDCEWFYICKNK